MAIRTIQFLALIFTALSLVPAGAHLAALPNKIDLGRGAYFTVQNIYRGWDLFGIAMIGAILSNLALAIVTRRMRAAFGWAVAGFLLMAAALAVFFVQTFPTNQATRNWTVVPENWVALRAQWEYGHATGAVLTFLAFCAIVLAVLTCPPKPDAVDSRRRPG